MRKLCTMILLRRVMSTLCCFCFAGGAATAGSETSIRTVAGDGTAGLRTGPALKSRFLFPTAMAMAPSGDVYIADGGAQRILLLRRDRKVVEDVAGSGRLNSSGLWVDPGYLDGPAREARFNGPAGLAVERNG